MASFLNSLAGSTLLNVSTIPSNGDLNPYGVSVVPDKFPKNKKIKAGNILVSNFNNSNNLQGTGTTIIAVDTYTNQTFTFFQSTLQPVGLTTALEILESGIVIVGNTPTTDGTSNTITQGSLIFLDGNGNILLNFVHPLIQGPWDMTYIQLNKYCYILYVSNVLNGTIVRIRIKTKHDKVNIKSIRTIGTGFSYITDPAALVIGPTGLVAYKDKLYVCDTVNNRIQVLSNLNEQSGTGTTLYVGSPLQGPLGLALSPQKTLIIANGDAINAIGLNNSLIEIDIKTGLVISTLVPPFNPALAPGSSGALFGIFINKVNNITSLIYIDDINNKVAVLPQQF